jgi:hypothetical protein
MGLDSNPTVFTRRERFSVLRGPSTHSLNLDVTKSEHLAPPFFFLLSRRASLSPLLPDQRLKPFWLYLAYVVRWGFDLTSPRRAQRAFSRNVGIFHCGHFDSEAYVSASPICGAGSLPLQSVAGANLHVFVSILEKAEQPAADVRTLTIRALPGVHMFTALRRLSRKLRSTRFG